MTSRLRLTLASFLAIAALGAGRIKVKPRQVGGKSKTITLTVPASVTG